MPHHRTLRDPGWEIGTSAPNVCLSVQDLNWIWNPRDGCSSCHDHKWHTWNLHSFVCLWWHRLNTTVYSYNWIQLVVLFDELFIKCLKLASEPFYFWEMSLFLGNVHLLLGELKIDCRWIGILVKPVFDHKKLYHSFLVEIFWELLKNRKNNSCMITLN